MLSSFFDTQGAYGAVVYKVGSTYYARDAANNSISAGTAAATVIQAAIDDIETAGGVVLIKAATYSMAAQITLPSNVMLVGEGRESTILQSTSALATNMVRNDDQTNGNEYLGLLYLSLDHSAATGGAAFNFTKVAKSIVGYSYFKGNSASFTGFWTGSAQADEENMIIGNVFDGHASSGVDQFGGGRLTDSSIIGNVFKNGGGSGGFVQRLPLRCMIAYNVSYNQGAAGISLETGQYCTLVGNVTYDNGNTGIVAVTSADGDPIGCIFIGNISKDNTTSTSGRGLSASGTGHIFSNNITIGNNGPGIEFTGDDCTCVGNICKNNGQNTDLADNFQVGIRITNAADCVVTGNRCFDDQGTQTQLTGIAEVGTSDNNVITNNSVRGNGTAGITEVGASSIYRDNLGYVTENKGTGTIANGATNSGNVAHGLDYTPSAGEFNIIFTENPTNTPGVWWISGIDATNFVLNVENDPGASGLDFAWNVRRI